MKKIDNQAFGGCVSLETITFQSTVNVDSKAFDGNNLPALKAIYVPSGKAEIFKKRLFYPTLTKVIVELPPVKKTKTKAKVVVSNKVKLTKMSNEVNLIGMNKDEALYEMKQFLDKARLINLSPVRIIHGFGEGILRKMVDEYLKKCDFVESYTLAGYGNGSGGATMVYLKKRNNV